MRLKRLVKLNATARRSLWGILSLLSLSAGVAEAGGTDDKANVVQQKDGWALESLQLEETEEPGVRRIFAEAVLQLPAAAAWHIISGEGQTRDWPGIKESTLEWSDRDTTIRRYTLEIPIYRDRRYKLRNTMQRDEMSYRFEMVPGYGNVRRIEGSWTVTELTDSTSRVTYRLETDPGVSLIPGFIVNWATKKAIPRSFGHIYEQASRSGEDGLKLGEKID